MGAAWDTEELRANVLSVDPNGENLTVVATGLRNCGGMTVQLATRALWCVVNERDELGDDTHLNVHRMSLKAPSMVGPGTSSVATKIRGRRAAGPISRTRSPSLTC